jgi:hypothetical protein
MTSKELILFFEDFFKKHPDVQRFKSDTEDRIDDFLNSGETFPAVYCVLNSQNYTNYTTGYKANTFSFDIFVLVRRLDFTEREKDDITILNQTNTNLEQCGIIANHFCIFIDKHFDNVDSTILPLNNYGIDGLQGVRLSISFEVGIDLCIENILKK